jgi:hypothetical protein
LVPGSAAVRVPRRQRHPFGKTTAPDDPRRFDAANTVECWAGDADYARGDASRLAGLRAGDGLVSPLRDDPFFVKGNLAPM